MLTSLFAAVALGQMTEVPEPAEATRLRPGEIVRYFARGGRTRFGQFAALLVITNDKIYIKSKEYSDTLPMNDARRKDIRGALANGDIKSLFQTKRKESHPPSAVDGTDMFVRTRKFAWDNTRYELPVPTPELIGILHTWIEGAKTLSRGS